MFCFIVTQHSMKRYAFSFNGLLDTRCHAKSQRELSLLLTYECLIRICDGTAEFLETDISPGGAVYQVVMALRAMYTKQERWSDLIGLDAFLLDRAIKKNSCLHTAAGWACGLGESLEAKGYHEQAARIYAEAGAHMKLAKHPKTASLIINAGLAWKRHGDYETAESCFCLALQAVRFESPNAYKDSVFNAFEHLFWLYLDSAIAPQNLLVTLVYLIFAAGGDTDERMRRACVLYKDTLKEAYRHATEEQMCRVVQSVVEKSTSVEEMRAAIVSYHNPRAFSFVDRKVKVRSDPARTLKEDARAYIRGCLDQGGYITSCKACGELKQEEKLMMCPCRGAFYCDQKCQKNHWSQHKAECVATRKSQKKKTGGR